MGVKHMTNAGDRDKMAHHQLVVVVGVAWLAD